MSCREHRLAQLGKITGCLPAALCGSVVILAGLSCSNTCPSGRVKTAQGECEREDLFDFRKCLEQVGPKTISSSEVSRISAQVSGYGLEHDWRSALRSEFAGVGQENERVVIETCIARTKPDSTAYRTGYPPDSVVARDSLAPAPPELTPDDDGSVKDIQGPTACVSACWNPSTGLTALQLEASFKSCIGQTLTFSGRIQDALSGLGLLNANGEPAGNTTSLLFRNSFQQNIACEMRPDNADRAKTLGKGKRVRLRGMLHGCSLGLLSLKDCELVAEW